VDVSDEREDEQRPGCVSLTQPGGRLAVNRDGASVGWGLVEWPAAMIRADASNQDVNGSLEKKG